MEITQGRLEGQTGDRANSALRRSGGRVDVGLDGRWLLVVGRHDCGVCEYECVGLVVVLWYMWIEM